MTNMLTYGVTSVASGKATIGTASTNSISTSVGFGGIINPQSIAVDGANNAWVSNLGFSSVSGYTSSSPITEFSVSNAGTASMAINALSGSTGFLHNESATGNVSIIQDAMGIGIDLSGNVWVTNTNNGGTYFVTLLVGAATPVMPPIPGKFGVAP
jgi:hypothetical protein